VTLSRKARCRALQLPTWNEAMSLPRPWDQQWSLRLQQILAYETDLLEYPDLFDGSPVVQAKAASMADGARGEIDRILDMGGVRAAIDSGYMKTALVRSMADRMARINAGQQVVVGVNKWAEGLPSPLVGGDDGGVFKLDPAAVGDALRSLEETRKRRDAARVEKALAHLEAAARSGENLMEPSIECALARVTTGEWAHTLRRVFGEYRAPTGVAQSAVARDSAALDSVRASVDELSAKLGRRVKFLVGKPGLDGHSNGAEQIAVRARDVGMDVVYEGIRLTPAQIVRAAVDESAHVIGLSILSGSHVPLVQEMMERLRKEGLSDVPVVVGGIIPPEDEVKLKAFGVAAVYTPKNYALDAIMADLVRVVEKSIARRAQAS
jgi:(2R)-ethylmalonyl-CoA mutase